jgi:regulator of RNase E activity RraA
MVGRAFTVQFMPLRGDVDEVAKKKAREHGLAELSNQTAIDMLQPGDVLVVDLFGKKVDGTIVGDNLFYYVMKATNGGGLVVDGSIRDLDGIAKIDMPAYFRSVDPTPHRECNVDGHQRAGSDRRSNGYAWRSRRRRPRRRIFHSATVRQSGP